MNSPAARSAACCCRLVGLQLVHLDDRVRPAEQLWAVVGWHAEQGADHRHRVRLRVVGDDVEVAYLEPSVERGAERSVGECLDARVAAAPPPAR